MMANKNNPSEKIDSIAIEHDSGTQLAAASSNPSDLLDEMNYGADDVPDPSQEDQAASSENPNQGDSGVIDPNQDQDAQDSNDQDDDNTNDDNGNDDETADEENLDEMAATASGDIPGSGGQLPDVIGPMGHQGSVGSEPIVTDENNPDFAKISEELPPVLPDVEQDLFPIAIDDFVSVDERGGGRFKLAIFEDQGPEPGLQGNLMGNDFLGDQPTIVTQITIFIPQGESEWWQSEFYGAQVFNSTIVPADGGRLVVLPVPASGFLDINTLLGGHFSVDHIGQYFYTAPSNVFPESGDFETLIFKQGTIDNTEHFGYTIQDVDGDQSSAMLSILVKDTGPEAFDNANIVTTSQEGDAVVSNFSDGFNGWHTSGHEHIIQDAAFFSTRNVHEAVEEENELAQILHISSNALDNLQEANAVEGSVMWRDIELAPGQLISFDYLFSTNDPNHGSRNDFSFLSLGGSGGELVYKVADTFDVNSSNINFDSTNWEGTTGWRHINFEVPLDWVAGVYRLGFGVMDVGSPNNTLGDASMFMVDNVDISNAPRMASGNVISDPNNYIESLDPTGATDILRADGGHVTQISFHVDGESGSSSPIDFAQNFINSHGLNSAGAYASDVHTVVVPVPDNGQYVEIYTPHGATLTINEYGDYRYFSASNSEGNVSGGEAKGNNSSIAIPGEEKFTYRLTDNDGSFDDAFLVIDTLAADISKKAVEHDRPSANLVFAIDVSGNMDQRLSIAKNAANAVIDQYVMLGYKLNITVLPFGSNDLVHNQYDGALVHHALDSNSAKSYINGLTEGFSTLGTQSEFDDVLNIMQRDVLPSQLTNLVGFSHVVYFLTDGDPTSGQGAGSAINDWQAFVDSHGIDVIPVVIEPHPIKTEEGVNNGVAAAFESVALVGNSSDIPVLINGNADISLLVNAVSIPEVQPYFQDCWMLKNVNPSLDGPYQVVDVTFHFSASDMTAAQLAGLLAQYSELIADVNEQSGIYVVTVAVPAEGQVSVPTALGGLLIIESDGIFSYRGPYANFEDTVKDMFTFTFKDDAHHLQADGLFTVNIYDTVPTAYDNANYVSIDREASSPLTFDSLAPFWSENGHEHVLSFGGHTGAFMSTHNPGEGSSENIVSEDNQANFLGLSSYTLDDVKGLDTKEGSVIKHTFHLDPGQIIDFDYLFATQSPGSSIRNDFGFLSLSGHGYEIVYDFADARHTANVANISVDGVSWDGNTGWNSASFLVPFDWESGNYVLGFGVMDVGSPSNTSGDASMLMIDNLSFISAPNEVSGNVILDSNEDFNSDNSLGGKDVLRADGGKVSLISFDVDGSASSYVSSHHLESSVNAYGSGNTVYVPVSENGVAFQTYMGGYLAMDQFGHYQYDAPFKPDASKEQFTYTLSEWDGNDQSTAHLDFYFTQDKAPSFHTIGEGVDSKQYVFDMDSEPGQYAIKGLDSQDVLYFTDVVDSKSPVGGAGQPDFQDVLNSWVQQGSNVVAQLQNNSVLVLQDIGLVPGTGTNADLEYFLQNNLNVAVNVTGPA